LNYTSRFSNACSTLTLSAITFNGDSHISHDTEKFRYVGYSAGVWLGTLLVENQTKEVNLLLFDATLGTVKDQQSLSGDFHEVV
jgi:hypothetical protein